MSIESGEIVEGKLPRPAARIVKEWALQHQKELLDNWVSAQNMMPLEMIQGADND